jgi:hypothetical protein
VAWLQTLVSIKLICASLLVALIESCSDCLASNLLFSFFSFFSFFFLFLRLLAQSRPFPLLPTPFKYERNTFIVTSLPPDFGFGLFPNHFSLKEARNERKECDEQVFVLFAERRIESRLRFLRLFTN